MFLASKDRNRQLLFFSYRKRPDFLLQFHGLCHLTIFPPGEDPGDDLLEVSVFALPDLEAVPEQALDLSAGRFLSSKTSFGERPSA